MRDFHCPNCGQRLSFENSVCLNCGRSLGFSLDDMALLVIAPPAESEHAGAVDDSLYQLCANLHRGRMQLAGREEPDRQALCVLRADPDTPRDADTVALASFAAAEKAKRRLIAELYELKLPIVGRDAGPAVRAGVRPAVQSVREGLHRP